MKVNPRTIDKVSILSVVSILWSRGSLMASVLGFELRPGTCCFVLGRKLNSQIASLRPVEYMCARKCIARGLP